MHAPVQLFSIPLQIPSGERITLIIDSSGEGCFMHIHNALTVDEDVAPDIKVGIPTTELTQLREAITAVLAYNEVQP